MTEIAFEERAAAQRYHVGDVVDIKIGYSEPRAFEVVRVNACYDFHSYRVGEAPIKVFRYELRRRG